MQLIQTLDRTPMAHERLTVTSGLIVQPSVTNRIYKALFMTVEDNNLRYRIDGGDPTAVLGHLLIPYQNLYVIDEKSVRNLRLLATGADANVVITYYN